VMFKSLVFELKLELKLALVRKYGLKLEYLLEV